MSHIRQDCQSNFPDNSILFFPWLFHPFSHLLKVDKNINFIFKGESRKLISPQFWWFSMLFRIRVRIEKFSWSLALQQQLPEQAPGFRVDCIFLLWEWSCTFFIVLRVFGIIGLTLRAFDSHLPSLLNG